MFLWVTCFAMPTVFQPPAVLDPPRRALGASAKAPPDLRLVRALVWLYLGLWVFEGALRKWFLPGLANPLLVVRDPVLLLLYVAALAKGVFPRGGFIPVIALLGAVATFVSMFFTNTPTMVTLFGLRADYLHLPLIFLLPEVLRRADLKWLGQATLAVAVGMAALVLLQFRSGAGAFLNRGAGEGAVMLESAFGHVRPSGTFSYTNGLTGFTAIAVSFFLQHLLEKRVCPRGLWLAGIPALLVLIVLSGSRLAAMTTGMLLGTVLLISLVQGRYRASSLKLVVLVGAGGLLVGSFAVFQSGLDVFASRFQSNNVEQTGMLGRYLEGYALPFRMLDKADAAGAGLGMGTNVAAGLLTGARKFMFSEGEGGRVIMENGPVVGLAYLLLRLCLAVYVGQTALRALRTHAATLPLLLFTGGFTDLIIGQFAQATELGYAVIAGGLCLAAARVAGEPPAAEDAEPPDGGRPDAAVRAPTPKRTKGRAAHALRLHEAHAAGGEAHE